jgi:maltose alpha-D-glucosyltransferase/alpha-amylase
VPHDAHNVYLALMHMLGERTAGLHRALATPTDNPDFTAEPLSGADLGLWRSRVDEEARATLDMLSRLDELPQSVRADAGALYARRDALLRRIDALSPAAVRGMKIRHHGDFHLGQVLLKRNDWVIADFEGEPARPLAARREKSTPLRDVAGMLRSFTYARAVAMQRCTVESHEDCARWRPVLFAWERATRAAFLQAYEAGVRDSELYGDFREARPLIELFELEKALYELRYELRNRPDWAGIPLTTLLELAGA